MKIIKTKLFAKWANKNDFSDKSLWYAALEIADEIYEANYGGGVIKKRVAKALFAYTENELDNLIKAGSLIEVKYEDNQE